MKSILQAKNGRCFLCMELDYDYDIKETEEHHVIYGRANRRLSEQYGLKIYLCHRHHRIGPEAVHNNPKNRLYTCECAQAVFQKRYPDLDFVKIFGKNYL